MANTGTGAVVAVSAGVTYAARWKTVSPFRRTVDALDDTVLSSSIVGEFVPDDLQKVAPIEFEVTEDFALPQLNLGVACLLVITYPKQGTLNNAATMTVSGFFTEHERSRLEAGVRLMGRAVFQPDGKTNKPTYVVAS